MAKGSSLGIQVAVAEAMDAVLHAHNIVQVKGGEVSQQQNLALCARRATCVLVRPHDSLHLFRQPHLDLLTAEHATLTLAFTCHRESHRPDACAQAGAKLWRTVLAKPARTAEDASTGLPAGTGPGRDKRPACPCGERGRHV